MQVMDSPCKNAENRTKGTDLGTKMDAAEDLGKARAAIDALSLPSSNAIYNVDGIVYMAIITFEDASGLSSIRIPASTEEIDGSAFIGCPLETIGVQQQSRIFTVGGDLLLSGNGSEIMRIFGLELEVIVPAKVEMLKKSCFESCDHVERVLFDNDSKVQIICRSALSNCNSLRSISIRASVEIIEESVFKGWTGLESCARATNRSIYFTHVGNKGISGFPSQPM
jgi:hypothetical protein